MRIGVPKEKYAGEKRVATTPEVAAQLMKLGYEVAVESGAGGGFGRVQDTGGKPSEEWRG